VHTLADIVAHGGNLLLNINPTATGTIPFGEAQRVQGIGWWLAEHGDAIYRTRPWDRRAGLTLDGQAVRYTCSADAVHAIVLGTPPSADVELDIFLADGAEARIPGHNAPLQWMRTLIGTRIKLPQAPAEQPAITIRLSPPEAVRPA
jgi:alpha-L-fucosidase